jgi:hypothetical protein
MSEYIDLHGLTVDEAMAEFIQFYNDCVERGYQGRIEVVHGYGSSGQGGAILRVLRDYLDENSSKFDHVLPGDIFGNPGITVLIPKDPLAEPETPVCEAIRRFCKTPKSEQRILAKLRGRFGDRLIRDEISRMENKGQLRIVRSCNKMSYEST